MHLRFSIYAFVLLLSLGLFSCGTTQQPAGQVVSAKERATTEQYIRQLSADKWQWMADKDVDKLADLFDDSAKFVHMSGSWKKERELEIIESGSIWYKNTQVHDVAVEVTGKVAVLWNRITLEAEVRGDTVSNEFTVTEVYQKRGESWKMLALTFSKVRDTHEIAH